MTSRAAGAVVGAIFGVTLCWSGMSSPNVIRGALLLQHSYLFLFFGSAVAVAFVGLRLVRGTRALLTGEKIGWTVKPPRRGQLAGAAVFGTGWALADACPGPVATQLGQGRLWSVFTLCGIAIGILLFARVRRAAGATRFPNAAAAAAGGSG
jgi:uncharacterized membrane protein YedE/YeeE